MARAYGNTIYHILARQTYDSALDAVQRLFPWMESRNRVQLWLLALGFDQSLFGALVERAALSMSVGYKGPLARSRLDVTQRAGAAVLPLSAAPATSVPHTAAAGPSAPTGGSSGTGYMDDRPAARNPALLLARDQRCWDPMVGQCTRYAGQRLFALGCGLIAV
jgi:hypothetical protein